MQDDNDDTYFAALMRMDTRQTAVMDQWGAYYRDLLAWFTEFDTTQDMDRLMEMYGQMWAVYRDAGSRYGETVQDMMRWLQEPLFR